MPEILGINSQAFVLLLKKTIRTKADSFDNPLRIQKVIL